MFRTLQEQAKDNVLASDEKIAMIDFIRHRTGEQIVAPDQSKLASGGQRSSNACSELFHDGYRVLDSSGSSSASIVFPRAECLHGRGGREASLTLGLPPVAASTLEVGFISVECRSPDSSTIADFPFYPLDLDADGLPRKGVESMYIEARKPL